MTSPCFLTLSRSARRLYFSRNSQIDLECYYYGRCEIGITTDEREEFERDGGFSLEADVISADQFSALLTFTLATRGIRSR